MRFSSAGLERIWRVWLVLAVSSLLVPLSAHGDAGVLLPRGQNQPDPSILSLEEMEITVRIDNGDARVFIRQVFANHTGGIQEGTYIFALPSTATVSDFAVWDGPTRIPAVILERKRAEEIYHALAQQSIDPGLLEMGERDGEEASRSAVFSAKITPIPVYGTKRLEIEYHERVPVENLKSYFALPLHPDNYNAQAAKHLWIHFELDSAHALRGFQLGGKVFPLTLKENTAHRVQGEFEGRDVNLAEDFSVKYDLDPAAADTTRVLVYRNPSPAAPSPTETSPEKIVSEPGFFEAEALLGFGKPAPSAGAPAATTATSSPANTAPKIVAAATPRTLILLFDTSLSMQWDKLERSYQALDHALHTLRPEDRFNLLLFNSEISLFQPGPVSADAAAIQKAMDFVRASHLRGGTNLQEALDAGLKQCASAGAGDTHLILLSDGGATRGTIRNASLAKWYDGAWQKLPAAQRPRTYVFAVGDDANLPLLRLLAQKEGVLESVLSTEPIEFKLNSFLSKIGRSPVAQLHLESDPAAAVDLVYPLQSSAFAGSVASWVGQYHRPQKGVALAVRGVRDGEALDLPARADLPAEALDHPQLPRLWARARVDALLEKIARDGEDAATIDEIIRLSRKYKFVTPYTSFLSVPRALLRPRVIRPGDPVLRVKTDASISSVIALFPFGLVKPLRYLSREDVWETRFLAPEDMRDGTYNVRLILRDKKGNTYREAKSFVIATTPPAVRIHLDRKRYRRGEVLALKVSASGSTRTLLARLDGASATELHWNAQARSNTGEVVIPDQMPAGTYRLTITAEDIAHNTGSQEVQIEVVP
jgi:Ca-activated chloride channel family protein